LWVVLLVLGLSSAVEWQDKDVDCSFRKLAFEYASQKILPFSRGNNVAALSDALRLDLDCSATYHKPVSSPPNYLHSQIKSSSLEFFVDGDSGDDQNLGTSETSPFKTILRAQEAVRGADKRGGVIVRIKEGMYRLRDPLVFSPRDSGSSPLHRVVYTSYSPSDRVVISGGVPLQNLDWKSVPSMPGVYVTPLSSDAPSSFSTLFVDGLRQVRARFPNGNPQTWEGNCISKTQYPGEGCPSYLTPSSALPRFKVPPSTKVEVSNPKRGGEVSGDDHFPEFKYYVALPPDTKPDFPSVFSYHGTPYSRISGLVYQNSTWTNKTWSGNGKGAIAHVFHGGLWGNWMFEVDSVNTTSQTINFLFGGWQEARGSDGAGHYYIENVIEELDVPGEWFLDEEARKLYYYPNATQDISKLKFVAPNLSQIIAVHGEGENNPVRHLTFENLEFTETAVTYMEAYEVPSGGDWSIHRGGALFVESAVDIVIQQNLFQQTGGNAVFFSNFVVNSTVKGNEFAFTGDSALAMVGSTSMIDAFTFNAQPKGNVVMYNHFHDLGVYGKQTSCVFQALSCGNRIESNACYNGPRAGFNFNDGMGGGHVVEGNLLFNMVRETGDHGPFNSWDRQPYLVPKYCHYGPPSIVAFHTVMQHNFIINGYNGVWTFDHDDGSEYYNDTKNVLVYGGCKNYLGSNKACGPDNLIIWPGHPNHSTGNRRCQTDDNGVFANQYYFNNTCASFDNEFYTWKSCVPNKVNDTVFQTHNNLFLSPSGNFSQTCGSSTYNLTQWQKLGQERGSLVKPLPSLSSVVEQARSLLGL